MRIPDIYVIPSSDDDEVIVNAPLLCIEVLSPDDRWSCTNLSVSDYLAMGIPSDWVIDPYERRAWIFEQHAPPAEVQDGRLTAGHLDLEVALSDVLPAA